MKHTLFFVVAFAFVLLPAFAVERIALVIGNNAYKNAPILNNAVNDARAVAARLKEAQFAVLAVEDATAEAMHEALEKFKEMAHGCTVGLVFYSGHGLEEDSKNYLVPVDAVLERKAQIPLQTLSLAHVLEAMKEAQIPAKVVLLDCCRNMPLARSWRTTRSAGGGLAALDTKEMPQSTLVYFATAPGAAALDAGSGGTHSPFTQGLLDTMTRPGIHALEALMQVEDSVHEQTAGQQRPKLFSDGETAPFRKFSFMTGIVPVTIMAKTTTMPTPATAIVPSATTTITPSSPVIPADLPSSGYFSLDEVFQGSSYASYNKYSRALILKKVQEKLQMAGLYNSSADGVMGKGSQRALLEWQTKQQIKATGRLERATLASLGLSGIEQSEPPASPQAATGMTSGEPSPQTLGAGESQITLRPGATNPLTFDRTSFRVKAGQAVTLVFSNVGGVPQPHNVLILRPGSTQRVITAANAMLTDPSGMAKSYIPTSSEILFSLSLIQPGQSGTLRFKAPQTPGDYPYICTFPGHSVLMNGVMKVER